VGAYHAGSDPNVDAAIRLRDEMNRFLQQRPTEPSSYDETRARLLELASRMGA
jgi:flagellum-specific ATP synthase